MLTKHEFEIQSQEELIKALKFLIAEYWSDVSPDQWDKQRGYIIVSCCTDTFGTDTTIGLEYVVLTEDEIVYRLSGDYQEDSSWEIVSSEEFLSNVIIEAEEILSSMKTNLDQIDELLEGMDNYVNV